MLIIIALPVHILNVFLMYNQQEDKATRVVSHGVWVTPHACQVEVRGFILSFDMGFQRNKMFLLGPLVKIQHCGEPPLPRNSMLNLRPTRLEFRVLCLVGIAIWFFSPPQFSLREHKSGPKLHWFLFTKPPLLIRSWAIKLACPKSGR